MNDAIKQNALIHTVANAAEIVANDELVFHASQGLKIGRAAPASFLDYANLPPLFEKVNEANGVKLIENIKTLSGLIASPVYTFDGNKTRNYEQALADGIWYEFNPGFDATKWTYQKQIQLPFKFLVASIIKRNPPLITNPSIVVEIGDAAFRHVPKTFGIRVSKQNGALINGAIPENQYNAQFWGFESLL